LKINSKEQMHEVARPPFSEAPWAPVMSMSKLGMIVIVPWTFLQTPPTGLTLLLYCNATMSQFPYGGRWSFLVSLGQNEQVLPVTEDHNIYNKFDVVTDWIAIARRQIADAFGLGPSCQFRITYIDKDGNEADLYVVDLS
jgi:hypothetical protein